MPQYSALLSIVFMMVFVLLFDRTHWRRLQARWNINLFSSEELDRVLRIWSACQES